tara:strand:- start:787 stop:1716 length:930 start_codon:yes stop_codon:yes gene_type:complete
MAIYYLNGTTLSNSTAVYDNAALTLVSADGFYADGSGISREQVSGILGPIQNCPECLTPCGPTVAPIVGNSGAGVYEINFDLGTAVGAVVIRLTPTDIPVGIQATYRGVPYNKLSSPIDGYHGGQPSGTYTYLGNDIPQPPDNCLPVAGTTYSSLTRYKYEDGVGYVDTGLTTSVTPQAGEISLTSGADPGICTMVIPKVSLSPNDLKLDIIGVCNDTTFTVEVSCPALLTGFSSSLVGVDSVTACGLTINQAYYNVPVSGIGGIPDVNDWVFSDAYGSNVLSQGFYKINATEYIEVDVNGVVITKGNC